MILLFGLGRADGQAKVGNFINGWFLFLSFLFGFFCVYLSQSRCLDSCATGFCLLGVRILIAFQTSSPLEGYCWVEMYLVGVWILLLLGIDFE